MNEQERKADYEQSANASWRWVLGGEDLLISARVLQKEYESSFQAMMLKPEGKLPTGQHVLAPMIYLKGKCIELFLKANYLKLKNGAKVTDGNGSLSNKFKNHQLIPLYEEIFGMANAEEKKFLKKLSDAMLSWGTYPVPVDYKHWRPEIDGVIDGTAPIYSWGGDDERIFEVILEKVRKQVDPAKSEKIPFHKDDV